MKKLFKFFLIILAIAVVIFVGMSFFIGYQVVENSSQITTCEETSKVDNDFWERYGVNYDEFCSTYTIEKLEITSSLDEHIIPADYIYAIGMEGNKNNKTVILVHGMGDNRYNNYPIAEMFLKNGYNIVTYDQRSTNENTAKNTTFGYLEKYDLIDYINYVAMYAPEKQIGVWGTSYGGATACLALSDKKVESKVDFLILDCPVSQMKWMIEEEIRKNDFDILPISYMTFCGNIVNLIKFKFTYINANVAKSIKNIEIPVLIINSKSDTITPQFMGQDIYNSIKNDKIKTIWTVEDSKHANVWLDYNQEYRNKVDEVLNKIN